MGQTKNIIMRMGFCIWEIIRAENKNKTVVTCEDWRKCRTLRFEEINKNYVGNNLSRYKQETQQKCKKFGLFPVTIFATYFFVIFM